MAGKKIPVYTISNLAPARLRQKDFLIERFEHYVGRHSPNLHNPHRHVFFHLVFFTAGSGNHSIDFIKFTVRPGQIYFMIPGQVHSWNFKEPPSGYVINFSGDLFRSFLQNPDYLERFGFFSGVSEEGVRQISDALQARVIGLFENMLSLQEDNRLTDFSAEIKADLVRTMLLQLFLTLEAAWRPERKHVIPLRQNHALLTHMRKLIEEHYRTLRLPGQYAGLLHVTSNHLNTVCRDLLGKSAGELIRDRILLEAKRLLTNADMTVLEIAYDLNFQDSSYFNRFFKRYEGLTPDGFRKKYIHS